MSKKIILGMVVAIAALASFATTSFATEVRVSPAGAISTTSLGKLTFSNELASIACNLTMNGRLSAGPIAETVGRTFGEITEVRSAECTGGTVERILVEAGRPWPLKYNSGPNGGLAFEIEGTGFLLSVFGGFVRCLYGGAARATATTTRTAERTYTAGGATLLVRADETRAFRLVSGSGCPEEGFMRGTFRMTAETLTEI